MPDTEPINKDKAKRLFDLRNKLDLSQAEFGARIGVNQANLAKIENGRRKLGPNIEYKLLNEFNINKVWWATGLGEMLNEGNSEEEDVEVIGHINPIAKSNTALKPTTKFTLSLEPPAAKHNYVPYYDIEVTAGKVEQYFEVEDMPTGYIYAPEFTGCIACKVYGDSMYDRIVPGATVFIKKISNKKYIDFGQIYVIVTEDFRLIKYLKKHPDSELVTVGSQNADKYPDWELEKKDIVHLFLVKGYWNQVSN